jgi:diguanylate cyclase (GGDEF)-like protein
VTTVVDAATALATEVAELEQLSRFDRAGLDERAAAAATSARALGRQDLELRAQLVQADLLRRRGNVAEAGRQAQEIHRWATEQGARHLLARTHFVLTAVFQELGDLSAALEYAVRAVDLLGEEPAPALQLDHLLRLADCLGLGRDVAARERYDAALALATDLGDVDRQLLVLNNRAYCETLVGAFDEALVWSTQLQALAAEHDIPLDVGRLDTVGRALMGLDRLEEAEEAMRPGLRPEVLAASRDGDAGADFLLTLAEVQRRRGSLDRAQDTLDECIRRCDRLGLTAIRVRARREQAELHAGRGDFRAAYEEHTRFADEMLDLQSSERDARARALQAMYETTEARRQTRRYRELSLRDPLTGLYNRRFVDERLPVLLERADSGGEPVTVALLDLDHFKQINDTRSHEVGDRVLCAVAELLRETDLPPGATEAFAARMGGEEFLLVVVGTVPMATCLLDDLRRAVRAYPWSVLAEGLEVSVSIGAATTGEPPVPSAAELLARADAHLYDAKRQGRDRVVADPV